MAGVDRANLLNTLLYRSGKRAVYMVPMYRVKDVQQPDIVDALDSFGFADLDVAWQTDGGPNVGFGCVWLSPCRSCLYTLVRLVYQ